MKRMRTLLKSNLAVLLKEIYNSIANRTPRIIGRMQRNEAVTIDRIAKYIGSPLLSYLWAILYFVSTTDWIIVVLATVIVARAVILTHSGARLQGVETGTFYFSCRFCVRTEAVLQPDDAGRYALSIAGQRSNRRQHQRERLKACRTVTPQVESVQE